MLKGDILVFWYFLPFTKLYQLFERLWISKFQKNRKILICILTKYFFRVYFFCLFAFLLSGAVSSGEFFPLCSLAWLAVAFFRSGLLCTAELRFLDRFFGPCSQEGSLKLCALLGFSFLRFFVCFRFFWSGLLCTHAQLRFSHLRTCSKDLRV